MSHNMAEQPKASFIFQETNGLTPHPSCDPEKRSPIKKGYCTQRASGLQKCSECKYGVWNLHQPFRYNNTLVCGWCFDEVKERGEPKIFDGLI